MLFIGEQNERQIVFGLEFCVGFGRIWADADHDCILLGDNGVRIAEATGLRRASRCVIFWIEVQNHPLAAKLTERDRLARLIRERKVWSQIAYLWWVCHSDPLPVMYRILQ